MKEKKNICVRLATPQETEEKGIAVVLEYFELYHGAIASGYVPEEKYVYYSQLEGYERISRASLLDYLYYNFLDENSATYFFTEDFV